MCVFVCVLECGLRSTDHTIQQTKSPKVVRVIYKWAMTLPVPFIPKIGWARQRRQTKRGCVLCAGNGIHTMGWNILLPNRIQLYITGRGRGRWKSHGSCVYIGNSILTFVCFAHCSACVVGICSKRKQKCSVRFDDVWSRNHGIFPTSTLFPSAWSWCKVVNPFRNILIFHSFPAQTHALHFLVIPSYFALCVFLFYFVWWFGRWKCSGITKIKVPWCWINIILRKPLLYLSSVRKNGWNIYICVAYVVLLTKSTKRNWINNNFFSFRVSLSVQSSSITRTAIYYIDTSRIKLVRKLYSLLYIGIAKSWVDL